MKFKNIYNKISLNIPLHFFEESGLIKLLSNLTRECKLTMMELITNQLIKENSWVLGHVESIAKITSGFTIYTSNLYANKRDRKGYSKKEKICTKTQTIAKYKNIITFIYRSY